MRQLPAAINSGATSTTENSRSRSQPSNDYTGVKPLSNGSAKDPILTRSKSRLKTGRRPLGRPPKKFNSTHDAGGEGTSKRRPDRGTGNQSTPLSSPRSEGAVPERFTEKMYARHYKSYRGLNGIKSRRGEHSAVENHSQTVEKSVKGGCTRDSPRDKSRSLNSRGHLRRNGTRGGGIINGRSPSPQKPTRTPSSRIRQLVQKSKNQRSRKTKGAVSPMSPQSSSDDGGGSDSSHHRDKVGKRRSALWVLNCEAESFLFGETAADKHEVELPPLAPPSPPPKKRRKWRVTELAHLLEKSAILESKLRKSSSSECGSDMQRDTSPPKKRLKAEGQRAPRRVKKLKQRKKNPELCSRTSKAVKGRNHEQVLSPRPELLSPIPFLYSPDSVDHEAKTVQFRQMLANVNWGYSFEEPPVCESWYPAFSRLENSIIPHTSFINLLEEPQFLPYELDKPIRRSRSKPVRNSRKSPRCHASTLAIMSSERPIRSTRSSVTLDASPPSSSNVQSESTHSALITSPKPNPTITSVGSPVPSRFSPPKSIPATSRSRHLSSPKPPQNNYSKEELIAQQYLWDAVQFLSDPYVVTLLAGENPDANGLHQQHHLKSTTVSKNHRCNNNNYVVANCPVKHVVVKSSETSSRKASLRSGDGSVSGGPSVNINNVNSSRLVSVPKCSPRNHSHGTNLSGGHKIASPPVSPSATVIDSVISMNGMSRRFKSRSPPPLSPPAKSVCHNTTRLSPKNSKGSNARQSKSSKGSVPEGDNGLIAHDKSSSKKSSVVLVTNLHSATTKAKTHSWEEESLFVSELLPPLPSWPV